MFNIEEKLEEYGLTTDTYEQLLKDCSDKVGKISDLDWSEINAKYGIEWNGDSSRKAQQPPLLGGAFVRDYYIWKAAQNKTDDYKNSVLTEKDELYKIKKQVADQRREFNKLLTTDARSEHLYEEITRCAKEMNNFIPLEINKNITTTSSNKEAVLFLTDWHFGMTTENIWNTYNETICKERIAKVCEYAREYISLNRCKRLNIVVLGDLAHGSIHTGCRVASEEDACDQLMHVSEILAEVINSLADTVEETVFHSTYGNHMRTIQNKNDSKHSDNMEKIVPWWLKERLKDRDDVVFANSSKYEFIMLDIFGKNLCCTHGDLEKNLKTFGINMNTLCTRKLGFQIDYAICGDKHHTEVFDSFGIESRIVSSLCGTDEYANGGRLYSNCGQTLIIFNERGRESVYDIVID